MENITLFGAHVSPYVRKTRLVLAFKGLAYQHIPVVPFGGQQPDEFKKHSPLGKIPLLKVADRYIPDSSIICSYLDKLNPEPALFPADSFETTRAHWFEEYADSVMVSCIGGHLFAEKVLARAVFKREPIQSDIDKALNEELPNIFAYLNAELKDDYLVGNSISMGDIAVCGVFIAMHHCQVQCDEKQWPKLSAYIDRVMALDFFCKVVEEETMLLKALAA
ncbi:MAG: glutathione S-transferase family protein [Oleiphilus sp.]